MHTDKNNAGEDSKAMMKEVNQDLINTRKSVEELIKYRMALMEAKESGDLDKIKEYKGKAIEAINHLFDEDINPEH
jgi:hypothetical protein